jgi:hypothetical protein
MACVTTRKVRSWLPPFNMRLIGFDAFGEKRGWTLRPAERRTEMLR